MIRFCDGRQGTVELPARIATHGAKDIAARVVCLNASQHGLTVVDVAILAGEKGLAQRGAVLLFPGVTPLWSVKERGRYYEKVEIFCEKIGGRLDPRDETRFASLFSHNATKGGGERAQK